MNKLLVFIFSGLGAANACAQISVSQVPKAPQLNVPAYDSSANFLGTNVSGYSGQELFLKPLKSQLQPLGYSGFIRSYTKRSTRRRNIYKSIKRGVSSRHDLIAGRYFTVLEIVPHPGAAAAPRLYGHKYYLRLREKDSQDLLFYEYDARHPLSFPFLVTGYFYKLKAGALNKGFVFADKVLKNCVNLDSGQALEIRTGETWCVTDLVWEPESAALCLVLADTTGTRTLLPYSQVFSKPGFGLVYPEQLAGHYLFKFGTDKFNQVLRASVSPGMTPEMCKLALGYPQEMTTNGQSEEWKYPNQVLVFSKGILASATKQ